ncbi:MAG: ABC-F family ATP-binding cassette domain-containing protein [Lachnospiraceae bacterium]|nr:ABC-F family ATP-binding cassette domain-containing protein [Lachnospiraceae bacterium]
MILACQNISKSFGTETVLQNVSFHVEEHEKTAIVGINGAGKSTLLKIIIGEMIPDSGEVTIAKGKSIGYLAQYQDQAGDETIYEEVLSACGHLIEMEEKLRSLEQKMQQVGAEELDSLMEQYHRLNVQFELQGGLTFRSEIVGVLKGLGFQESEFERKVSELSGGQKTRVALSRLLLGKPDLIILDEPTNHLDMNSIAWLENYLAGYKGAVIVVAHDRYFLDQIVTKVVELSRHVSTVFHGNYTEYARQKEIQRESLMRQYLNQQREIKHQEQVIDKLKSFNREKSIKRAESREKALEKVVRMEKPVEEHTDIHITLEPEIISGNDVLTVRSLAKSYEKPLFSGIDFELKRGERVALIGNNGTGKTTILKIINDLVPADAGEIVLGTNVHIGYYDQEHQNLNPEHTLFEEIGEAYPDMTNTRVRNVLAAFLFTEDDVFKKIKDISGGERGRVSLAKLVLSKANFLILDEPTNHLDIISKEILESALNAYTGTVLYVSHDRYFINRTASRILDLSSGRLINYIGNYDYYLEKKETLEAAVPVLMKTDVENGVKAVSVEKQSWEESKKLQAAKRKLENDLKKTEQEIAAQEEALEALNQQLSDPEIASNSYELGTIHERMTEIQTNLEALYEKWEQLSLEQEEA